MSHDLISIEAGTPVVFGGNRVTQVPAELAEAFRPGDRLVVVQDTGDLLHIPQVEHETASGAVGAAVKAFSADGHRLRRPDLGVL